MLICLLLLASLLSWGGAQEATREPGSIRKSCSRRGATPQPPSRVNTTERLQMLRVDMSRESSVLDRVLDAYIIMSYDEHQNEYTPDYDKRLQFISGFSGSVGTAVVTQKKAALWVDGRFHVQADNQLDCNWLLMRKGHSNVPEIFQWLRAQLNDSGTVGMNPKLVPHHAWAALRKELANTTIRIIEMKTNLVDMIWKKNRPEKSKKKAYLLEEKYTGESWLSKVTKLRQVIKDKGASAMVVTALDEIAWLLNLRGRDIPQSPLIVAYAIVMHSQLHLYVDIDKMTVEVKTYLRSDYGVNPDSVKLHRYEAFWRDLPTMTQVWGKVLLPSEVAFSPGVSHAVFKAVPEEKRLFAESPIIHMKAQKNAVERNGMRQAHIRDSVALCDFLAHFEGRVNEGDVWEEMQVAKELNRFRYEQVNGLGNSFETVVGFGPNGAQPNYHTSNETNAVLDEGSTLVLGSGGQYLEGTTDVTRTFHLGEPTSEQKAAYTRVLAGQIQLSTAVFPSDLPISSVDVLARTPLWEVGIDYLHSTGHGVGAFLGVNESPIELDYRIMNLSRVFKDGYFFTIGPGYYREGDFGIRLGNVVEVKPKYPKYRYESDKQYLGFETATLVPYEPKLIETSLLTSMQKRWLNEYNARIRILVGAELKKQGRMSGFYWMMENTKHIPENEAVDKAIEALYTIGLILLVLLMAILLLVCMCCMRNCHCC